MDCAAEASRDWYHKNLDKAHEISKKWRDRNPERRKELRNQWRASPIGKASVKNGYLLRAFGISLADYVAMAVKQGGVCLICAQAETRKDRSGRVKPLSVDHDHTTGKVRGLLCDGCNNAIGNLRDDPRRARAVARYLEAASGNVVELTGIGGT
jgi:hypothetical protein